MHIALTFILLRVIKKINYHSRKEHSSQYVFLRGNCWFKLFENIGHRIRKLQQAADEPYLSERHASRLFQLYAAGKYSL